MPARTADNGENYADEINYMLWNPKLEMYMGVSLDQARGKVISMTTVRLSGDVVVYLKNIEDCVKKTP